MDSLSSNAMNRSFDELPVLFGRAITFSREVAPGDFLVSSTDFAGSNAGEIIRALGERGVAAVIARSFGDVLLHAAIEAGLPPLIVEETGAIKTGDRLRVDIEAHTIANLSSGDRYVIRNMSDEEIEMLRARRA